MALFGITGYYREVDKKIERRRYSVIGDPRGATFFKLIDATLNSPKGIVVRQEDATSLEYRDYEAESEEKAIEAAREEGLISPSFIEVFLPLSNPVERERGLKHTSPKLDGLMSDTVLKLNDNRTGIVKW